MATLLQKQLAQNIVANAKKPKKLNKKELVVSSGYGEVTADRHASEIIKQKGVQEELANLGFDTESAKKVVRSILVKGKEENRLKAADMIFKVTGGYAPEKHLTMTMGDVLDQLEKHGQSPEGQELEDQQPL